MSDLKLFFDPVQAPVSLGEWGVNIDRHRPNAFPNWKEASLIIIGAPFQAEGAPADPSPDFVRNALYALSSPAIGLPVADLGNLCLTDSTLETESERLAYVLSSLHLAGKTVIILGGSQALTLAQLAALPPAIAFPEYVHIDNRFDLLDGDIFFDERSFNKKILTSRDFDPVMMTHLGYQTYLTPQYERDWLRERRIPATRYSVIAEQPLEAEPALRTSHAVSFDLAAVRASESPGAVGAAPGGFDVVEACRLARFAGMGYALQNFGLYGYHSGKDPEGRGAALMALLAWHVAEGIANRMDDHPRSQPERLRRFSVHVNAGIPPIAFFQHLHTGRWWMEAPHPDDLEQLNPRVRLIACTENDYQTARRDEIPERWWQAFQGR